MKNEQFCVGPLSGHLWTPDEDAEAVILVVHGMTEHAGRYEGFARQLTARRIAVAAYDLRGHGANASPSGCAAMARGDWESGIGDIDQALIMLRERFSRPVYLLGFSLGSFQVREYMELENGNMDGVILIGTGTQPRWLLKLMQLIVKSQIKKAGFEQTTPLVRQLSFGAYNQKFKPNRTDSDWLCSDGTALDGYLADPLCSRDIASGTFFELLGSMERTGRTLKRSGLNSYMPVLLLGGECDPVGNFGKGTKAVERLLRDGGYAVSARTYPKARHMLLCEESGGQAAQATEEIVRWIRAHI